MLNKRVDELIEELIEEIKKDKENIKAIILLRDERDGHTAQLAAGDGPTLLAMLAKAGDKLLNAMRGKKCNGDCDHCDLEHSEEDNGKDTNGRPRDKKDIQ